MVTHYILSDGHITALGGDPVSNPPIPGKARLAIRPEKLIDGGWALPVEALTSATAEQAAVLEGLTVRDVALEEFQWVVDAQENP